MRPRGIEEGEKGGGEVGVAPLLKSRDPHLAGREKNNAFCKLGISWNYGFAFHKRFVFVEGAL